MVSGLSLMSMSAGTVSSVYGAAAAHSGALSSAASEKMLSSSTIVDHNHHESVEEFNHEQAVEMMERKTILIRYKYTAPTQYYKTILFPSYYIKSHACKCFLMLL